MNSVTKISRLDLALNRSAYSVCYDLKRTRGFSPGVVGHSNENQCIYVNEA